MTLNNPTRPRKVVPPPATAATVLSPLAPLPQSQPLNAQDQTMLALSPSFAICSPPASLISRRNLGFNRISGAGGMTPAIERFANMDVHSSSKGLDDASFDDLDRDVSMDIDDDDLDIGYETRRQASTREETHKTASTTSTQ